MAKVPSRVIELVAKPLVETFDHKIDAYRSQVFPRSQKAICKDKRRHISGSGLPSTANEWTISFTNSTV